MSNEAPEARSLTRRDYLRSLALAATLGQSACLERCDADDLAVAEIIIFPVFIGQVSNQMLVEVYGRKRAEEIDRQLQGPLSPYSPLSATGPVNGIAGGSASGPAPASAAPRRLATGARGSQNEAQSAFYLLDTSGDAQVDARVYAFDVFADRIALRGQAVLLPRGGGRSGSPYQHLALSADGGQLVASRNGEESHWAFVDAASLSVTGRISAPAGQFARRAVFSPDGKTVFLVAATGTSSAPARLHVADAASRTLIGQIDLPPTLTLEDLAVTPDGGLLVGASFGSLHSIDVRSGTYGGSVRVTRGDRDPAGPRSGGVYRLAMDATGSRVYFALIGDPVTNRDLIGIADVRTLEMVGEIPVRQDPSVLRPLLRISPAGDELFYARQLGTGVQVFDIRSGLELDTILVEPAFRLTELVVA
ncbi:MAG: hypothetical protein IPM24_09745 [Bryobacterales bacterium]|nr:hypothetical protein [Bryobacterales bacterium]